MCHVWCMALDVMLQNNAILLPFVLFWNNVNEQWAGVFDVALKNSFDSGQECKYRIGHITIGHASQLLTPWSNCFVQSFDSALPKLIISNRIWWFCSFDL